MQRYAEYKDSGVDWLGEVPLDWTTAPIRSLFIESRKKNHKLEDSNYLSLMAGVGVIPYAEKGDVGNKMPEDLSNCKIVTPNDFVLNSMNFGIGSFGRSKYQGVCSSVYVILKGLDITQLSYFERVFQQPLFQKFSQSLGNGILAHRCAIGWDELKNERFPVPPSHEVFAIAAFLDDKVSKIDELVKIKRRQIELLTERKQILIQNAVTKGLNPDTPMKDSGIDWIGKIPSHWEVKRLAVLGKFSKGGGFSKSDLKTEGVGAVLYGDIYTQYDFLIKKPVRKVSMDAARKSVKLKQNDLLFTGSGETKEDIGKCVVFLGSEQVVAGGDIIIFRQVKNAPIFLNYMLNTLGIADEKAKSSKGEIIVHTYASKLKELRISIPPHTEQTAIATFLDNKIAKINNAITIKQNQITKLNEYKSTLINAAVTGKIKVT